MLYSGGNGEFWTPNPERAASYGPVRTVTVPKSVAEAGYASAAKLGQPTTGDTVLPSEWVNKAVTAPHIKPTVTEAAAMTPEEEADLLKSLGVTKAPSPPAPAKSKGPKLSKGPAKKVLKNKPGEYFSQEELAGKERARARMEVKPGGITALIHGKRYKVGDVVTEGPSKGAKVLAIDGGIPTLSKLPTKGIVGKKYGEK